MPINTSITDTFDIAIVGAGMVGLSLACALAPSGLRISIIDRAAPQGKSTWQGNDARVSAIVKSSEQYLKNIGSWSFIEQERYCAYSGMEVWEQDGTARIDFDSADIGHTELGYIVENRVMQWAMLERLKTFENIHWLCPESITRLEKSDTWQLQLESNKTVSAQLLVGADGALSFVREQLNIQLDVKDLEHKAIVCNVQCEKAHASIARQIFLKTGPLAFLPLAESPNACSIVWSADHETADALMALDEHSFNKKLAQKFEHSLGDITVSDKRICFPLYQRHARHYISEQAVLIGDAAHTIHPLAGQGVNLGYMDSAVLAEEILRAHKRNISIAGNEVLRRYERRRRGQVSLMMHTMRGFQQLFSVHNADLIGLRNLGVKLTNKATPVKHHILSRAMGIEGDVPALARVNSRGSL